MSSKQSELIHLISGGGVSARHRPLASLPALVGPATAKEFNTIKAGLIPIACWRVEDLRFEFDSSFVKPQVAGEIKHLRELREKHKRVDAATQKVFFPPASIFGHADPVGNDDYNKQLSGRRAAAIYGLLTRNTKLWEELYSQPFGNDKWGEAAIKTIQQTLKLNVTGKADAGTRKALFGAYMDHLCTIRDKDGQPMKDEKGAVLSLEMNPKDDFLARGEDPAGKGDYQGCSEFNPMMIFSRAEHEKFQQAEHKSERDKKNAPNRRVMVLLFRVGSKVLPARWPCPRAKEGIAGCQKRFWSDAEERRTRRLPDKQRIFQETADTFACRFYQRLSGASPCERMLKNFQVRLYDSFGNAIPFAPFTHAIGDREFTEMGRADARGMITLLDIEVPSVCTIKWGFEPKEGQSPALLFSRTIFFIAENEARAEAAPKKLHNLGYDSDDEDANIIGFQLDYGHLVNPPLSPTGEFDDRSLELLDKIYQQTADDLRETKV
jgi:hypothetical protein